MASRLRFARAALLISALTIATASTALAAPTAADRETARALVAEGKQRRDKGDLPGALESFKAADAIMHVSTTGMLVAKTQEQMGLLVDARDTAVRVARLPLEPNEPKAFTEARAAAEALANDLGPKIPTLKISLTGVKVESTAARVTIDDAPIPNEALVAPRKMNPGHHVIVAKLGTGERHQEIDLAERDAKEVTLDLTGMEPVASNDADTTPERRQGGDVEPPDEHAKTKTSPLVYLGFGVGIAGVAVGSVFGIMTLSKKDSISGSCRDNKCPPSTYDDLDTANTFATVSTIGFVAAGVGVTLGIIGLAVGGGKVEAKASTARARVVPWIGPGSAGMRGTF